MSRHRWAEAPPRLLERKLTDDELRDLLTDKVPSCKREPSEIRLLRCPLDRNAWAPLGSYDAGVCLCCNTPFPRAA